jgi:hypothetical protein
MRYISFILFAIFLVLPQAYTQPHHGMYAFIGGSVIGRQLNNLSVDEKINYHIDLTEVWVQTILAQKEEFWSILKSNPQNIISKEMKSCMERTISSHIKSIHPGLGYAYSKEVTFEAGFLYVNSHNFINSTLDTVGNYTKSTVINNLTLIQKTQLGTYANCRFYAQLGAALSWGYTNAPFLDKRHLEEGYLYIPKTFSLIGGAGAQYPISSFLDIDISWIHLYVTHYYHFNLIRVGFNFHQ